MSIDPEFGFLHTNGSGWGISFQPMPHTPDMRPSRVPEGIGPFGEGTHRKRQRSIEDGGNRNRKRGRFPPQEEVLGQQNASPVDTQYKPKSSINAISPAYPAQVFQIRAAGIVGGNYHTNNSYAPSSSRGAPHLGQNSFMLTGQSPKLQAIHEHGYILTLSSTAGCFGIGHDYSQMAPYTNPPQVSREYQQSNNFAPIIHYKTDPLYGRNPPHLTTPRENINSTVRTNAGNYPKIGHPQQESIILVRSVGGSNIKKPRRPTLAPSATPSLIKSNVFDMCEEWMFDPTLGGLIPQGGYPNSLLSKRNNPLESLTPKDRKDLKGLPNTGDKRGREHLSPVVHGAKKQRKDTDALIDGEHEVIDPTDEEREFTGGPENGNEAADHTNSPNEIIDLTDDNEPITLELGEQDEAPVEKGKQLFPKFIASWEEGKPNPWQEKRLQIENGQAEKAPEEGPLPYNGVEHALKMGVLYDYSWYAQMSAEQKKQEAKSKSAMAKVESRAQGAAYKPLEQSKLAPKLVPDFKREEYAFDLIQDPLTSLPDGSGQYRCNHDCTGKECPYKHPCCKKGLKWSQKRETLVKAWKRKTLGEGYIVRTRRGNLIYPKEKGGMTVKDTSQASNKKEKSPLHAQKIPDIPDDSEQDSLHIQKVPVTPKTPSLQRPRILFPSPRRKPATLGKSPSVESNGAAPEFEDPPEDNDGFEDALKEALEKELSGDDEDLGRENLEH